MSGTAKALADEDEEQQRKAHGQCGHHGYLRLLGLAFALGWLGDIHHLNNGTFAAFVHTGHFVLFGKQVEQGLVVFEVAKFGDVVAVFAAACRSFFFSAGQLTAHGRQLNLRLFEVGRGFSQVAAHGGELDFLRSDAGFEFCQAFYGRRRAGFDGAAVDAAGLQGLLGFDQVVFGSCELFFKEHAALLGFGHSQAAEQLA